MDSRFAAQRKIESSKRIPRRFAHAYPHARRLSFGCSFFVAGRPCSVAVADAGWTTTIWSAMRWWWKYSSWGFYVELFVLYHLRTATEPSVWHRGLYLLFSLIRFAGLSAARSGDCLGAQRCRLPNGASSHLCSPR